jgi:hypothetical protein
MEKKPHARPTHAIILRENGTHAQHAKMSGNNMIYVAGLPDTVTEAELSGVFGSIGQLKFDQKKGCDKVSGAFGFWGWTS